MNCTKEYVSPLVSPLALENLNENEMERKRIDGLYVPQDFGEIKKAIERGELE